MTDKKDDPDLQDKDPELVEQHYKQVVDGVREMFDAKRKQPEQHQEPFIYYRHYDGETQDYPDEKTIPLYTSPPAQRKPLTDEEIHKMAVLMGINPEWKAEMEIVRSVVRNLEAKLWEKNA